VPLDDPARLLEPAVAAVGFDLALAPDRALPAQGDREKSDRQGSREERETAVSS